MGALKGLVLPRSAWVSSSEFSGLTSAWVLSPRRRGSSAPSGGGLQVKGGLTLGVECSDSSVFTYEVSAAVDCLEVDPELRASIGDLEFVVKARGRSCLALDGDPMESFSPSSKTAFCVSVASSEGISSSGGICPPRCKRI